ncbi:4Fe-4S binding protein [Desulfofalx alkaliphila]|uniref:4Fe-4S binding protein n=1 Tax=Desulfofalx alkaliphila TaxID=105483 RepID=UPI0004E19214|nr:4Fe-4S binding protein [Desulfofalx alkaliphila]
MPPVINKEKCTGCGKCEEICPGDLMEVDESTKVAFCRDTRDCWDCMACTKECSSGAIETRIPYQLGYYPAKLIPKKRAKEIEWTCIDIYGKEEKFIVKTHNK